MVMLTFQLLSWWYSQGWLQVIKSFNRRMVGVSHVFSVPILVRTLWSPWRRIVTYPGAGLDARLRAMGDNLVSRCIGFTVRILVLLTAGLALLFTAVLGLLLIVAWPIIPPLVPVLVIKGIIG